MGILSWLQQRKMGKNASKKQVSFIMPKDWLKRKLSVEQAEAENMVTNARLGQKPVPFGFCNREWTDLIAQLQPGDELWKYSHVEGPRSGGGGIAIIRNGEFVAAMRTWVS